MQEHQCLQGCGKLNIHFLTRLTSKTVVGKDDIVYPAASKLELLTVIYLSQIADSSGFISEFKTKSLSNILGCSERAIYVILKGLSKKGYIDYTYYDDLNWSGLRDIRLIGNDFSNIKKFNAKTRYVSTFYSFFDFSNPEAVGFLTNLSLYALRLLLILLSMYDYRHGSKISCNRLCKELGISDRSLIKDYLSELESFLGTDFYEIVPNMRRRLLYGTVLLSPRNSTFVSETPSDQQLTYYKRRWLLYFINNNMVIDSSFPVSRYLNMIFNNVYAALIRKIPLECIEKTILESLAIDDHVVSMNTLYNANNSLLKLIPT